MNLLAQSREHVDKNKNKALDQLKPGFHLAPEVGWMNDPNGFVFYQGEYHLFYQANPYDSKWDTMHWGHAKSKDLIHWEHLPMALAPDQPYDRDGCFSGSAIVVDDELILMYTGIYKEDGVMNQVQCIATSKDGINFEKHPANPVIDQKNLGDMGTTVDFRDPKVFERNGKYYTVIASKKGTEEDSIGQVFMFHSDDLIDWSQAYNLLEGNEILGNIWECPDLFELDGHDVLILSPMNMPEQGHEYKNLNSSIAMIGKVDWEDLSFEVENYHEIDLGLDFYAPQTMLDEKGRRVIVAWQQTWGRTLVLDEENHGWSGVMTIPRILSVENNQLIQQLPTEFYENLIAVETKLQEEQFYQTNSTLLNYIKIDSDIENELVIELSNSNDEELTITQNKNVITFSRKNYGPEVEGESTLTNERSMSVDAIESLEILIDKSSVEIFAGGRTMSNNVYAFPQADKISIESNKHADKSITIGWVANSNNKIK